MPENTQYFIYAILAAAVILIILMIIALALLFTFSKYFANRKFRVKASFDVNPDTKEDGFTLTVYNNNLNDVRINDFGLIYNGERITYTERYRTSHGCVPTENPIILAHGLIWLDLPVKELEELLKLRNKGSLKLKKLAIFVDDSLGIQTTAPAKAIAAVIKKDFKAEKKELDKIHREEQKKVRQERRKAWFANVKAKLASLFKKKEKKA